MSSTLFQPHTVSFPVGDREMSIETGRLAKQAAGAVVVRYGATAVLVTACSAKPREGIDFFPLTVDFVEKTSAAGKIPGGFFKREGRLSDREILVSRFIDRSIRPLFRAGYRDETQVIATVLSVDGENAPDIPAFVGASAALSLSDLPFLGPIAAVRVGRVDGEFVANPTRTQLDQSDLELVVAGSDQALVMVEGGARELPEDVLLAALRYAHEQIRPQIRSQEELCQRAGRPERACPDPTQDAEALLRRAEEEIGAELQEAVKIADKGARTSALQNIKGAFIEAQTRPYRQERVELASLEAIEERRRGAAERSSGAAAAFQALRAQIMRQRILREGVRIDGRGPRDVRTIACELRPFPRVHGSALFTRGETQALCSTTLGSADDQQIIDSLTERYRKPFLLHYNFPPFSVGEARFLRGPARREVGHGNLAERAVTSVLPDAEEFPYTVRIVSEILESNGSSSMATVCGSSLALMDAGVPIRAPVAGIAMGLIQEGEEICVLSDILGDEDHLGDMDFKVAGTRAGVTALQMDIKVQSVDWEVLERALAQAREGRLHILQRMEEETAEELSGNFAPRSELSAHAPRLEAMWIKADRIRDVIGPGGRVIRAIQETAGVKLDVEDSGQVHIFSPSLESLERARSMIEELTQEAEMGRIYVGKVKRITDFGAFVEIFPGTDGMIHISHIAEARVEKITDVVSEGDEVVAKCVDIDPSGRIRLSRKEAIAELAPPS